jgi:hypothetical protein
VNFNGLRESPREVWDSLVKPDDGLAAIWLARLALLAVFNAIADGAIAGPSLPRGTYRPPKPSSFARSKKSVLF